jgi:hypothetical protein
MRKTIFIAKYPAPRPLAKPDIKQSTNSIGFEDLFTRSRVGLIFLNFSRITVSNPLADKCFLDGITVSAS